MITRASDYQFITPLGQINGGILPAREVAANGSLNVLRAEDCDFAIEALDERMSLNNGQPAWPLNPSMVVKRQDWYRFRSTMASRVFTESDATGAGRYRSYISPVDWNYVFTAGDFHSEEPWGSYGHGEHLTDVYPNCVLSGHAPSSSTDWPSKVWNNDYVRLFYYDLKRSDRLLLGGELWRPTMTLTRTYHDEDNNQTTQEQPSSFTDYAFLDYVYREHQSGRKRRYYGYTDGTVTFTVPKHQIATEAILVVLDELDVVDYINDNRYEWARSRVYNVNWNASGLVTMPKDAFVRTEDYLVSVAQEVGVEVPFTTTTLDIPAHVANWLLGYWLIVKYNFRSEIRSLNWGWTPNGN